jgi:hypothetical protein
MIENLDLFADLKTGPSTADLDWYARRIVVASYLYYRHDVSMMTDGEFDGICQDVADHWSRLEPIRKFMLGSPGEVRASGFHVKVTMFAESAAFSWMNANRQIGNEAKGPITEWNFDKTHHVHWAGVAAT